MEFLDGISLTKAIEPGQPLKANRSIHIAKQLCRALGAAHDAGIVHRDLKPDNIYLISRGGDRDFVKVLDFGIAKVGGQKSKLTQVGQVFGTPHYMSPEQCAGTVVDKRTDIYALGVIMYEMASSRVPFDADNLMGILTKHLYEEPVMPHELPPPVDVPPALEAVIMKCLAKKADVRYQTMQEVLADLELVEQGLTPSAVLEGVRRASQVGVGPRDTERRTNGLTVDVGNFELPKSRGTGLLIGAVALLLVVGGGAFFALSGGDSKPAVSPEVSTDKPATAGVPGTGATEKSPTPAPTLATSDPTTPKPAPTPGPEENKGPAQPSEVAQVRVQIASTPTGAEVHNDGALLGRTPFTIERPKAGQPPLDLVLKLSGFKDAPVRISPYTQEQLQITLARRWTAPTPPAVRPTPPTPTPKPADDVRPRPRPPTEVLDPWN
jgi:serine/threonine-protein kinase